MELFSGFCKQWSSGTLIHTHLVQEMAGTSFNVGSRIKVYLTLSSSRWEYWWRHLACQWPEHATNTPWSLLDVWQSNRKRCSMGTWGMNFFEIPRNANTNIIMPGWLSSVHMGRKLEPRILTNAILGLTRHRCTTMSAKLDQQFQPSFQVPVTQLH